MEYEQIVEALRVELGFERVLGVECAVGGQCQECGRCEDILYVHGRSYGHEGKPGPLEDFCVCADRKACRAGAGEQRRERTTWVEAVYVPTT